MSVPGFRLYVWVFILLLWIWFQFCALFYFYFLSSSFDCIHAKKKKHIFFYCNINTLVINFFTSRHTIVKYIKKELLWIHTNIHRTITVKIFEATDNVRYLLYIALNFGKKGNKYSKRKANYRIRYQSKYQYNFYW